MLRASFFALLVACGGARHVETVTVEPLPTVSASPSATAALSRPRVASEIAPSLADGGDPRPLSGRPVSEVRQQAAILEQLVATVAPHGAERPKLLLRLADTYSELRRLGDASAAARSIAAYRGLTTTYPGFAELDRAWFGLGKEYASVGDLQGARRAYYELIRTAPNSKLVPFAYYAFGELFFADAGADPSKLMLAEQAYMEVQKFTTSPIAPWALCKLARCFDLGHEASRAATMRARLTRDYPASEAAQTCGAP